jgi:glyoxylate reductase
MMSTKQFAMMKKTAIFINTARGPVVDETALVDACRNGNIFAAGIDVTDPEPPVKDSPLFHTPNIVCCPHIASATIQTRNAMATIAARNLIMGVQGKPLMHEVPETAAVPSKL